MPPGINKVSISPSPIQTVMNAFTQHTLINVRKTDGQLLGLGYIAILYGEVAFRMYSKNVKNGSHFIRMEEIADVFADET